MCYLGLLVELYVSNANKQRHAIKVVQTALTALPLHSVATCMSWIVRQKI